jgi:hypothetical protein
MRNGAFKVSRKRTGVAWEPLTVSPLQSQIEDLLAVFDAALHVFSLLILQRGEELGAIGFSRHIFDDHVPLVGMAVLRQRQESREAGCFLVGVSLPEFGV